MSAASEHLSEKEIRQGEAKAAVEVQIFTAACIALWFCMWTPTLPVPSSVERTGSCRRCTHMLGARTSDWDSLLILVAAPHVVEWARKLF